jgi:hypothetical protein
MPLRPRWAHVLRSRALIEIGPSGRHIEHAFAPICPKDKLAAQLYEYFVMRIFQSVVIPTHVGREGCDKLRAGTQLDVWTRA